MRKISLIVAILIVFTAFAQLAESDIADFAPADTISPPVIATSATDTIPRLRPEEPMDLSLQIGESGGIVHVLSSMGIGTGSPGARLHVSAGNASYALFGPNSSWAGQLYVGATPNIGTALTAQVIATDGNLHLDPAPNKNMYLGYYQPRDIYIAPTGGNVGIGTTGPFDRVSITGRLRFGTDAVSYQNAGAGAVSGDPTHGIGWGNQPLDEYGIYVGPQETIYSGNYTKLVLNWHTGIKIGASTGYGGITFWSNSMYASPTELFSIGRGDNHVRVNNYLFAQYLNSTDNSVSSGVTGIMVKCGDNYYRTATSGAIGNFLGNYGNWIPNNGSGDWQIASSSTATGYSNASLELREANFASSGSAPPRLSFHWGGVVASQIGIESSGRIAILNNPGTGYENLIVKDMYIGSYGGLNSSPTTYGSIGLLQAKGGYYGVLFGQATSNPNLMYDGSGNGGIYYQNWGWLYYTTSSNKYTGFGTTGPSYKLHVVGDIYANGGWLRTSGNAGWYSESYGGGWYMIDGTYIRNYNNKALYITANTSNSAITTTNNSWHGAYLTTSYVGASAGVVGNATGATSSTFGVIGQGPTSGSYDYRGVYGWGYPSYNWGYGVYGYGGYYGGRFVGGAYGHARRRPTGGDLEHYTLTAGLGASGETAIRGMGLVNAGYFISDTIGIIAVANPENGGVAIYSEGNTYTTGVQATIISSDRFAQRTAVNSVSSQDVEVILTGSSELIGGQCVVAFDEEFLSLVSSEVPFCVIVTPNTGCEYPIAVDKNSSGFIAMEMMGGTSNGSFDWMVIARRKGFESRPELPDNLADKDFDEKMYLRNFDQSKDRSPKYSHPFFFPTPPPRAPEENPDVAMESEPDTPPPAFIPDGSVPSNMTAPEAQTPRNETKE